MDASIIAIAAIVVSLLGAVVALSAKLQARRSAKAAEQQAALNKERLEIEKSAAEPKVEARITSVERDDGGVSIVAGPRNLIWVVVSLHNLSTKTNIVEAVSIEFRNQTYSSEAASPAKLHTDRKIPIAIEGESVTWLKINFKTDEDVAEGAKEEATVIIDCRYGGKRAEAFSVFQ